MCNLKIAERSTHLNKIRPDMAVNRELAEQTVREVLRFPPEKGFILENLFGETLSALYALLLASFSFASGEVAKPHAKIEVLAPAGTYLGHEEKGALLFPLISYAKPPIGRYRWRRTVAEDKAIQRKNSVMCPQHLVDTFPDDKFMEKSEDCLYLNVWAPKSGKNHPVIFFIHGGAYFVGSGVKSVYDGSVFARRDIVFVSINYRLGDLGFGPKLTPLRGSLGILDQNLALQWAVKNIESFGGDPNRIYLMGQSKGAESNTVLIESGLADEHVKGAIAFSNAVHTSPDAYSYIAKEQYDFLPGEIFMEADDISSERGFRIYVPELPSLRRAGERAHRFRVLTSGIQDEFDGAAFCGNLNFAANAYDYIDTFVYILHPGTADHGVDLYSIFLEDDYGKMLLKKISVFVNSGLPESPHLLSSIKPFSQSHEIIHLFPHFSWTETLDPTGITKEICQEKGMGLHKSLGLKMADWVAHRFGGWTSRPAFDPLVLLR